MNYRNIQIFVLKAGDSTNYHPNVNGPNEKLKYLYYMAKSLWTMKYGTEMFLLHQMNCVLVETWDAFTASAGNTIMDSFVNKKIPPLRPPN